jgi:hypothetical protein
VEAETWRDTAGVPENVDTRDAGSDDHGEANAIAVIPKVAKLENPAKRPLVGRFMLISFHRGLLRQR